MKRLLALAAPVALLTSVALAQEAPEAARMDLWCGIAFSIVAADVPADASAEQKAVIADFKAGSETLIERATAAHLEAGYDEAGFAAHKLEREAHVTAQVNMAGDAADYSFEQCAALLGL